MKKGVPVFCVMVKKKSLVHKMNREIEKFILLENGMYIILSHLKATLINSKIIISTI